MDPNVMLEDIKYLMNEIIEDRTIPRNIRGLVNQALDTIEKGDSDLSARLAQAITYLDEAVNDMNIPDHARTEIWNLVAEIQKLIEILKNKEWY